MRILEVASTYPAPVVGERIYTDYRDRFVLGEEGVQAIEDASPGCVVIRGTHRTIVVPFAWQRVGETPVVVPTEPAKPAAEGKRARR